MARNIDKKMYRLKCRILAQKVAKMKLDPIKIPDWLSKQKWFMQIQGVSIVKGKIHTSKKGAVSLFGAEWCDSCFTEELLATGVYEKQISKEGDIESVFPVKLKI